MNTRQYAVAARVRLAIYLTDERRAARAALISWSPADGAREAGWIQAYDEEMDRIARNLLRFICSTREPFPTLPSIDTSDASLVGWYRTEYATHLQRSQNRGDSVGVQRSIAQRLREALSAEEDLTVGDWVITASYVDHYGPAEATRPGRGDRDYDVDPPMTPIETLQIRQEAQALLREQARARVAVEPRAEQPRRQAVPDFPAEESWVDRNGVRHDGPRPRKDGRQHPGRGDASSEARRELREVLKRYQDCELLPRNDRLKAADEFHEEMTRIRSMLPDGFVLEVNQTQWHARIMKMNPSYIRQLEKAKQADKVRKGARRLTVGRRRGPVPGTED